MKITVQSSKAIRPARGGAGGGAPSTAADAAIPLTVFDKANYDLNISGITFFRLPAPPNAALAAGLAVRTKLDDERSVCVVYACVLLGARHGRGRVASSEHEVARAGAGDADDTSCTCR